MAVKSMSYDHPTYITRQIAVINLPAVAASVSAGKFPAFTAIKIKSLTMMVNIAGTNAASGYDVLNGTSSVGAFVVADSAAGYQPTRISTDITLASGGYLDIKTKASSATQSASVAVEYEFIAGADVTA